MKLLSYGLIFSVLISTFPLAYAQLNFGNLTEDDRAILREIGDAIVPLCSNSNTKVPECEPFLAYYRDQCAKFLSIWDYCRTYFDLPNALKIPNMTSDFGMDMESQIIPQITP